MKVKRLKRLLGIPLYRAVGILETLWLLCADCCDEGNIGKFTDDEIADYLEWDGSASELVRALSDSGWTDPDKDGRPVIHDWFEHCPEYIRDRVRKRDARAGKPRISKTYVPTGPDKQRETRTCSGQDPATTVYSQPNPTQPNPTNSNPTQPNQCAPKARRTDNSGAIPPSYQTPEVLAAIGEWCEHHQEKFGSTFTDLQLQKRLTDCLQNKWTPGDVEQAIGTAIERGWKRWIHPKETTKSDGPVGSRKPERGDLRAALDECR